MSNVGIPRLGKKIQCQGNQIQMREPDSLMVITGGPIAYRRTDGVLVILLACLKN